MAIYKCNSCGTVMDTEEAAKSLGYSPGTKTSFMISKCSICGSNDIKIETSTNLNNQLLSLKDRKIMAECALMLKQAGWTTDLVYEASTGNETAVYAMISCGFNVNVVNEHGETALMKAAACKWSNYK